MARGSTPATSAKAAASDITVVSVKRAGSSEKRTLTRAPKAEPELVQTGPQQSAHPGEKHKRKRKNEPKQEHGPSPGPSAGSSEHHKRRRKRKLKQEPASASQSQVQSDEKRKRKRKRSQKQEPEIVPTSSTKSEKSKALLPQGHSVRRQTESSNAAQHSQASSSAPTKSGPMSPARARKKRKVEPQQVLSVLPPPTSAANKASEAETSHRSAGKRAKLSNDKKKKQKPKPKAKRKTMQKSKKKTKREKKRDRQQRLLAREQRLLVSEPPKPSDSPSESSGQLPKAEELTLDLSEPSLERQDRKKGTGDILPEDILIRIFRLLPDASDLCNAAVVCISWRDAARDASLWQCVRATDPFTRARREAERCASTTFECAYCFDTVTPIPCAECGPNLKGKSCQNRGSSLRSGVSQVVDVVLRRAGASLRSLDLSDCFRVYEVPKARLKPADIERVSQSCPLLEDFRVASVNQMPPRYFVSLAKACQGLRVLHIDGCLDLTATKVTSICSTCPIEDLAITDCPKFRPEKLDSVLEDVRDRLRKLDISRTNISSFSFRSLMQRYPKLERFCAQHCEYMTERSRGGLGQANPGATVPPMRIFQVDNTQFPLALAKTLFEKVHTLETFSANNVPVVSDIRPLFDGHLPNLRSLGLAGQKVMDEDWTHIYTKLRHTLVECDMSNCAMLTCELPSDCNEEYVKLRNIYLTKTSVTDDSLAALIGQAPKLEFAETSGCRGVANRAFRRDPVAFYREEMLKT